MYIHFIGHFRREVGVGRIKVFFCGVDYISGVHTVVVRLSLSNFHTIAIRPRGVGLDRGDMFEVPVFFLCRCARSLCWESLHRQTCPTG